MNCVSTQTYLNFVYESAVKEKGQKIINYERTHEPKTMCKIVHVSSYISILLLDFK